MERRSIPSRYAEAFWPLAFLPLLGGVCVFRLVQRPSATVVLAITVLGLVAVIGEVLVWQALLGRWRGEPPGRLGRAMMRIEQDKWVSAVFVALWLSMIGVVLKWPFGDSVVAGITSAVSGVAVLAWALAARADRPTA